MRPVPSVSAYAAPPPKEVPHPAALKRILVVDDLPEMCLYLRTILQRIREPAVRVETEYNSRRALERVRSERFDLVLCDARMPHVLGVEILTAARAHNPEGLRFLITAYDGMPAEPQAMEAAGVDVLLRKPIRSQEALEIATEFMRAGPQRLARWRSEAERPVGLGSEVGEPGAAQAR